MARLRSNITRGASRALIDHFNSTECADEVVTRVLGDCLQVSDSADRPAEHSYQEVTYNVPTGRKEWGLWFSITHVSVVPGRNFHEALGTLLEILTAAVKRLVPVGKRVQIYCQITTDQPVEGTSNLFEMDEGVWVEGEAQVPDHSRGTANQER